MEFCWSGWSLEPESLLQQPGVVAEHRTREGLPAGARWALWPGEGVPPAKREASDPRDGDRETASSLAKAVVSLGCSLCLFWGLKFPPRQGDGSLSSVTECSNNLS